LGSPSDYRPDVWIPFAPFADRYTGWAAAAENRDIPLVRVFARLEDGVRREQALAELQATAAGLDDAYPRLEASRQVRLERATWIDPRSRLAEAPTVRMMTAAAGGLLLLVCANVANLLLSVAAGRQRELALQASLGASPARLLRQILAENVVLATIAGVVALLLASPLSARLGSYFARPSVWGANVSRVSTVDGRVVAFAFLISLATGLIAGVLPAIWASRRDLVATLKTGGDAALGTASRLRGRRGPSPDDLLVAAQVALSVVLLVVAGLVLRTLLSASSIDPGFEYDSLLTSHISTSSTTLEIEERERFFREVAEQITEEPWVRAATVVDSALLSPQPSSQFEIEGRADPVSLNRSKVLPGFFEVLGIEVLRGRSFTVNDTRESANVAIVNETFAERVFPDRSAVGRHLRWPLGEDTEARSFEIVGVVQDIRSGDFLADPEAMVYFSFPQHAYPSGSALVVSAVGDPAAAVPFLSRWLRDFEPHLAIVNVLTYNEIVRGFLYTQRMNAELFAALAVLGLALAAVGIFSVMSLAVSRRTREIGIRMAIGAQRANINRMMLGRALIPVLLGLALGLIGSLAATGLVQSLLYGVEPTDPVTLLAGGAVLVIAALSAAYLPARRATMIDPVSALRRER
jgi:predicted permease